MSDRHDTEFVRDVKKEMPELVAVTGGRSADSLHGFLDRRWNRMEHSTGYGVALLPAPSGWTPGGCRSVPPGVANGLTLAGARHAALTLNQFCIAAGKPYRMIVVPGRRRNRSDYPKHALLRVAVPSDQSRNPHDYPADLWKCGLTLYEARCAAQQHNRDLLSITQCPSLWAVPVAPIRPEKG